MREASPIAAPEEAGMSADAYPHLFVLDEAGKLLHSQDTALLEAGKSYDLAKFTRFLKDWSPPRKAAVQ